MGGLIFNGLFAAVLVFLYNYIGDLQYNQVGGETLGPVGFPRLLIIVILIGLAIVSIRDFIRLRKTPPSEEKGENAKIAKEDLIRLVLFSIALVAYLILLNYIGFIVCTMCFVFAAVKIIGYRKTLLAAVTAVGITLIVSFVFGELFNVALPRGVWFFRELSRYIY